MYSTIFMLFLTLHTASHKSGADVLKVMTYTTMTVVGGCTTVTVLFESATKDCADLWMIT